jgi:hypothetical protein
LSEDLASRNWEGGGVRRRAKDIKVNPNFCWNYNFWKKIPLEISKNYKVSIINVREILKISGWDRLNQVRILTQRQTRVGKFFENSNDHKKGSVPIQQGQKNEQKGKSESDIR